MVTSVINLARKSDTICYLYGVLLFASQFLGVFIKCPGGALCYVVSLSYTFL